MNHVPESTSRAEFFSSLLKPGGRAVGGAGDGRDIMRYTVSPIVARLTWPLLMRTLFGPQSVPEKFAGFPKAMAVRPSQIRASAAEAALMVPGAVAAADTYSGLRMPVAILAGADDRVVDAELQSARLHGDIA
ncbi:MAG: hypothetical protein KA391_02080 [Luteimonas sp.]|nr:hypothetical protein [Luteimonas sp.]